MRIATRGRLLRDRRGATIIEFAMVAPAVCLVLMGGFDVAHSLYMRAVLQGVLQKTARDSSLETGTSAATLALIDAKVRASVTGIANNADLVINRRFYRTFSKAQAALAETWTDTNHNGLCDNNEPFQDDNNNGTRDLDGGDGGQGTAKDRTVYTAVVTYPHFFPLWKFIGTSSQSRITAMTVLENQPYGDQGSYTASVGHCT